MKHVQEKINEDQYVHAKEYKVFQALDETSIEKRIANFEGIKKNQVVKINENFVHGISYRNGEFGYREFIFYLGKIENNIFISHALETTLFLADA